MGNFPLIWFVPIKSVFSSYICEVRMLRLSHDFAIKKWKDRKFLPKVLCIDACVKITMSNDWDSMRSKIVISIIKHQYVYIEEIESGFVSGFGTFYLISLLFLFSWSSFHCYLIFLDFTWILHSTENMVDSFSISYLEVTFSKYCLIFVTCYITIYCYLLY